MGMSRDGMTFQMENEENLRLALQPRRDLIGRRRLQCALSPLPQHTVSTVIEIEYELIS